MYELPRIMQHEMDSTHRDDKHLTNARLLEQKGETVARPEAELEKFCIERDDLYKCLLSQVTVREPEPVKLTTEIPLLKRHAVEASTLKVEAEKK